MFKRVLFGLFFICSLGWIAYVGYDIFQTSNDYSELHLFNSKDGELLIVNRPGEIQEDQMELLQPSMNLLISSLADSSYSTGYFSTSREHFLLKSDDNWTQNKVKKAFKSCGEITNLTDKGFSIGAFNMRYRKSNLYASIKEYEVNREPLKGFVYDQQSSASVLHFSTDNSVELVTDIYVKSSEKVVYATRNNTFKQGKQIHDESIFAEVITRKFDSYHFNERDYYATLDSTFANSVMSSWIQNGFVELDYEGETVLISDYIDGQDPLLILNDVQQTYDAIKFKEQLTDNFPANGQSYYVKYLQDLVVIAQSEETCDQLIADHKVGNTIALNSDARNRLYADLPRAVSERKVTSESRVSKAVYKGYLLETRFGKATPRATKTKESIALTCNFDVKDFAVLPGLGNAIVLGVNGEIVCFKNRKEIWKKQLEGKPSGDLQLVNLHGTGEGHVLINTEDEILLWTLQGKSVTGFPVKMESAAINEVKFYRWKNNSFFIIADSDGNAVKYDSKGRELTFCKSQVIISEKIDVWSSNGRLFYGFRGGKSFEMYDVAKRQSHRTFDIAQVSKSGKIPNELIHYGFNGTRLARYDQQGTRTDFQNYSNGKLIGLVSNNNNPVIIVKDANEIHLVNQQGVPFGQIHLPFNEVSDISYSTSNSGKTIVAVIDGLENNVYLYDTTGSLLLKRPLEGETKVDVESTGAGLRITTVVDKFVIQYLEN